MDDPRGAAYADAADARAPFVSDCFGQLGSTARRAAEAQPRRGRRAEGSRRESE